MIGCPCEVCQSDDSYNKRLRSSILVQTDSTSILIDTSPDFRQQALQAKLKSLSAVLYTHYHFDHLAGLDDLRALQYHHSRETKPITLFADKRTLETIKKRFAYCFHSPTGIQNTPRVVGQQITHFHSFHINDIEVLPLPVYHGDEIITGYCLNRSFAYFTDISLMPASSREYIKGLDTVVLTALRHHPHKKHFSLQEAMVEAKKLHAERIFFTHVSHKIDHGSISPGLPGGMQLAYDGLEIFI